MEEKDQMSQDVTGDIITRMTHYLDICRGVIRRVLVFPGQRIQQLSEGPSVERSHLLTPRTRYWVQERKGTLQALIRHTSTFSCFHHMCLQKSRSLMCMQISVFVCVCVWARGWRGGARAVSLSRCVSKRLFSLIFPSLQAGELNQKAEKTKRLAGFSTLDKHIYQRSFISGCKWQMVFRSHHEKLIKTHQSAVSEVGLGVHICTLPHWFGSNRLFLTQTWAAENP